MTDALDPASLVEAAQKAVADGDYAAAERLLRDAAARQEASLGSSHPDLASTLNNLAFVCERTNKFAEAERGYRRAHAIAVASLSPGHPLIATSLKNLVEFCAAHEIPIWKPPAARSDDESPLADFADEPSDDFAAEQPEAATALHIPPEPTAVSSRVKPLTIAAAALGIAIIVVVLFTRQGQGTTDPPRPLPQPQQKSAPSVPPASAETPPAPPPESQPAVVRARLPETKTAPTTKAPTSETPVTVLNARLCSGLEKRGSPDWQCASVNGAQRPGTYFFYTRLLTNANTTVEHRWYRENRVHQVMRLRVSASPSTGYRTFSGNTVSPERAGEWKVELRAADGTVLHEERFVVR
jgi:Protein of unknown function (DUF2914)/Tetratricopeptide repeat